MPWNQVVTELLTASGSNFRVGPVNFYRAIQSRTPAGIASAVALTFMGARVEFWPSNRLAGVTAFFSQIGYKPTSEWKEEHVFWDPLGASTVAANSAPGRAAVAAIGQASNNVCQPLVPMRTNSGPQAAIFPDELRDKLVPINKKYPIQALLDACAQFPLGTRQRITFEYVLIDGVNDTDADARRLVKLLSQLRSKVNLLPLNLGKEGLRPSSPQRVRQFQELLSSRGLAATIRRPRGADIFAACGQLHRAESRLPIP
jgi:hypothetical protein